MTKREREYLASLKLKINKLPYEKAIDLLYEAIFDTDELNSVDFVDELYKLHDKLTGKENV